MMKTGSQHFLLPILFINNIIYCFMLFMWIGVIELNEFMQRAPWSNHTLTLTRLAALHKASMVASKVAAKSSQMLPVASWKPLSGWMVFVALERLDGKEGIGSLAWQRLLADRSYTAISCVTATACNFFLPFLNFLLFVFALFLRCNKVAVKQ